LDLDIVAAQIEEIVERAVLDRERAVHIGFAEMKARIEEELAAERAVMQPNRDRWPGRTGKDVALPVCVKDAQRADSDEMLKKVPEQHPESSPFSRRLRIYEYCQSCCAWQGRTTCGRTNARRATARRGRP